jgi:hypothetical protein
LLDSLFTECSNDTAAENMLARKGFLVDSNCRAPTSAQFVSLAKEPAGT